MQYAIATVVVLVCCIYSSWTLMPAALRRPLARLLMRNRWLANRPALQRAAQPAGSGCAGCENNSAPAASSATRSGESVIRIVRQKRN